MWQSEALPAQPAAHPAGGGAPLLLIVGFCLSWSSAFAVGKIGLQDCPPLLLLTVRFLIAGGLLVAFTAWRGEYRDMSARTFAVLALLGLLNNTLYLGLSYSGMTLVSSGFTAIVISINPVLVAAAATLFLGERMSLRRGAGLMLGLIGVALVVRGRLGGGSDDPFGMLLIFGALVALATGTLLFKRLAPQAGVLANTGIQTLVAGLALLPAALLLEDPGAIRLTGSLLGALAFLVLVTSIGAYVLWFLLLQRTSATEASAYHFLMPPLGLLFGWVLLGEAVQPWDLLGILPVAVGIRLVTKG
jgi:drug/metabolite transporter (DMT)-like permease